MSEASNRSAAALLEELHRQSPEGRRRKLRGYANVGLLCIDEVGYLSFDDKAADLLYEVVNRRYERKPVILTTNRPFKERNEVFLAPTAGLMAVNALMSQAVQGAQIISPAISGLLVEWLGADSCFLFDREPIRAARFAFHRRPTELWG